ncbi:hypothetical protein EDC04DRAFT_2614586 [Pisolithus marmoratus]|nr:hypothetical protein EDC04DRAFT_2614586 [Pisolithus marmoratus]
MYEREIEELQHKLLMTTAECDTIRLVFQALIGVLKLPEDTNPLSFLLTSINVGTQANMSERVQLSKDTYPGLCFWMWTKISVLAKSLIYQIMIKEHPLLGLDEDSFKLEMLCVNDYSDWRKNHLTPNGKWKEPSHKTEPKEEPKLEYTDIVESVRAIPSWCKSAPSDTKTPLGPWIVVEKRQEIHSTWNCQSRPDQEVMYLLICLQAGGNVKIIPLQIPPIWTARITQSSMLCPSLQVCTGVLRMSHVEWCYQCLLVDCIQDPLHKLSLQHLLACPLSLVTTPTRRTNSLYKIHYSKLTGHHFSVNVFGMNGIAKKPPPAPTYPSMPAASQEPPEPSTAKMKKSKMRPGAARTLGICVHIDG